MNNTILQFALMDYKSDLPVKHNGDHVLCISCDVKMIPISDTLFECPVCDQQYFNQTQVASESMDSLTGNSRTRYGDYRLQQIQNNRLALIKKNMKYEKTTGKSGLPEFVLDEAARLYSSLQISYYNLRRVKFVRRGKIKDQILACLVFKILKKKGMIRQRSEISIIFELEDTGFSVGETQVQELEKALDLDLVCDDGDEVIDLATRYLKDLDKLTNSGIFTTKNLQFVIDIVIRAEVIKCGICCYLYSRIAGAIFILTQELKMDPKNKIIEQACDSCKKNTFERFKKIIMINYIYFEDIFTEFHTSRVGGSNGDINTLRLPHMKKYISRLSIRLDIPEIHDINDKLISDKDLPDDFDPYVDAILAKYDYPNIV